MSTRNPNDYRPTMEQQETRVAELMQSIERDCADCRWNGKTCLRCTAASAMLAALKHIANCSKNWAKPGENPMLETIEWNAVRAIAQARAAGITTTEEAIEETRGASLITGETVYLVTHNNRFGAASWAFSTRERADAYAFKLASRIWKDANRYGAPADDADWWTAFYEQCPDNEIETDQAVIDTET